MTGAVVARPSARSLPLRRSLVTGAAVGAAAFAVGCQLLVTKWLAVTRGSVGLGHWAEAAAIGGIAALIGDLGVSTAMTRRLGTTAASGHPQLIWATRLLTVGFASVWVCAAVLLRGTLSTLLSGQVPPSAVVAGTAGGLIGLIASQELVILAARRNRRMWSALTIVRSGASVLSAVVSIQVFDSSPASAYVASMIAASALVLVIVGSSSRGRPDIQVDLSTMRHLIRDGATITLSTIFGAGSYLVLPLIVSLQLGTAEAGRFRVASLISGGAMAIAANYFASMLYPSLCATIAAGGRPMEDSVRQGFMAVASLSLVFSVVAAFPLLLRVVSASSFRGLEKAWGLVLAGDALRSLVWVLSYCLLASGVYRKFLTSEVLSGVALVVVTSVAGHLGGLISVTWAFAATFAVLPLVYLFRLRVILGGPLAMRALGLWGRVLIVGALTIVTVRGGSLAVVSVMAALGVWLPWMRANRPGSAQVAASTCR